MKSFSALTWLFEKGKLKPTYGRANFRMIVIEKK